MPDSWGDPSASPSVGNASAISTRVLPAMVSHRCRTTALAIPAQARLGPTVARRRGHVSRGPAALSNAGTKVTDVATLSSGISSPPKPMLRRNGSGTSTSAASDTATVTPLSTTLRPAVVIARRTASSLSRPPARSSRQRVTTSSE